MESEIGTIEDGKKADLILVDGDPLKDIKILEWGNSVKFVMKGGEVFKDERPDS